MKRISMLFLLTTICIVCFTGKPQSQTFQERYEVAVDVTCKNQSVQRIIESHIKRELRSLQDVDVKASGKYTIAVVALEGSQGINKAGNRRYCNSDNVSGEVRFSGYKVQDQGLHARYL